MTTKYEVIVDYDEAVPLADQPVVWSRKTKAGYEGWTVFPEEYRARPDGIDAAVALVVNGEVLAVQRSLEHAEQANAAAALEAARALVAAADAAAKVEG